MIFRLVSLVALTCDIWTSRATQEYLSITCHYMDRDWNLRSYVLETIDFSIDHTSENVAAGFVNVTEARDIKKKRSTHLSQITLQTYVKQLEH